MADAYTFPIVRHACLSRRWIVSSSGRVAGLRKQKSDSNLKQPFTGSGELEKSVLEHHRRYETRRAGDKQFETESSGEMQEGCEEGERRSKECGFGQDLDVGDSASIVRENEVPYFLGYLCFDRAWRRSDFCVLA
jgi:hypothetical protein